MTPLQALLINIFLTFFFSWLAGAAKEKTSVQEVTAVIAGLSIITLPITVIWSILTYITI